MKFSAVLKKFFLKKYFFIFLIIIEFLFTTRLSFADEIRPTPHNIVLSVKMDRGSLPNNIMIFDNIFGGQTTPAKPGSSGMVKQNRFNHLTCLSRVDTSNGACPINPYWGNGETAPMMAGRMLLRFTQEGTGKSVDLIINGIKKRPPLPNVSLWNATGNISGLPITLSASIPRSQLLKLTPGIHPWKAKLVMHLSEWTYDCRKQTDVDIGCPGNVLFNWTADITLKITDYGTQQIYFPEYAASNPVVDLGLKINNFGRHSATAEANKTVDMCLYDGNNSSSSQISILFNDEGKIAPGREKGSFSLYLSDSKVDPMNRLDYTVSIIDPKTGISQPVLNGQEIIWTGVSADEGLIRTKFVKIPGINGIVQCVPAPITFRMPTFKLSSKSKGHYMGILRITYTPTTQSSIDSMLN